jgi:hypothetical protein
VKGIRRVDFISALVMLALSAIVAGATLHLPYWTAVAPGPAFASFWTAGAGGVIGIALLIQSIRSTDDRAVDWPDSTGLRQVMLGIAAMWLLFFMLAYLGVLIASTIFMLVFLLVVERQRLVPSLITTVITVGLFELVFDLWLGVRFPQGIFGI